MKKYDWRYNDTAAIMFSTIDTQRKSRIYRMAMVLKDEKVDPERLKKAVELTMPRYPVFNYREVPGFFWAYLEKAKGLPLVEEEKYRPGVIRRLGNDGSPEVNFLYYDRRISLEMSHIYCDGMGASELLKSVVANYLILGGMDKADFPGIRFADVQPTEGEQENPFARYVGKEEGRKVDRGEAWSVMENTDPDRFVNYISGQLPVEDLKRESKKYGLSITEYLTAVLILTSIKVAMEPIKKNIVISVPANMRQLLPTESTRNFASDLVIRFNPEGRSDVSLDEICAAVKGQLKSLLNKDSFYGFINKNYGMTQNKALQLIPFFVKHPGLNLIQKSTHTKEMSWLFSNLGVIGMPPAMAEKIERVDFCGGDARVYDMSYFLNATGHNGFISMAFSVSGRDNVVYKTFFRILASEGINLRAESSECRRTTDKARIYPKMCPACKVRIGEEYTECPLCGASPEKTETEDTHFRTALFPQNFEYPKGSIRKYSVEGPSVEKARAFFSLECCDLNK